MKRHKNEVFKLRNVLLKTVNKDFTIGRPCDGCYFIDSTSRICQIGLNNFRLIGICSSYKNHIMVSAIKFIRL